MDYRITSSRRRLGCSGTTLPEFLIGLAIGAMVLAAVAAFTIFSSRSIAKFFIYSDLDQKNRQTLDQMVREFRMVKGVSSCVSNSLTLVESGSSNLITYTYDPLKSSLTRVSGTSSSLLLTNCGRLKFTMQQRNITNGTFDFYPTTNAYECKAITVSWCCQRKLLGMSSDDQPQTATIVIRN